MKKSASAPSRLSFDELLSEANTMARPCTYLSSIENDLGPVGKWRGTQPRQSREWGNRLCCFDMSFLPANLASPHRTGVGSLYNGYPSSPSRFIVTPGQIPFERFRKAELQWVQFTNPFTQQLTPPIYTWPDNTAHSILLYAYHGISLPDVNDLVHYGTTKIQSFARVLGADPSSPTNFGLAEEEPFFSYDKYRYSEFFGTQEQIDESPLRLGAHRYFITLGGWQMRYVFDCVDPGPEPSWTLLASIHAEAEPWREIWCTPTGEYKVLHYTT